jgi:hypothetical protein
MSVKKVSAKVQEQAFNIVLEFISIIDEETKDAGAPKVVKDALQIVKAYLADAAGKIHLDILNSGLEKEIAKQKKKK